MPLDGSAKIAGVLGSHSLVSEPDNVAIVIRTDDELNLLAPVWNDGSMLPGLKMYRMLSPFFELPGNPVDIALGKQPSFANGTNSGNCRPDRTVGLNAENVPPRFAVADEMDGDCLRADIENVVGLVNNPGLTKQEVQLHVQTGSSAGTFSGTLSVPIDGNDVRRDGV